MAGAHADGRIRHAGAVGGGDWREIIGHDGYFVVRLHLFTAAEGGQARHLQSGFRATWWADGIPHPMDGPIVLAESGRRSVAPGGEAVVHVRPLQPAAWIDVEPGMQLCFGKRWARALGDGQVLERLGVPRKEVPLRLPPLPRGSTAAVLHRRPTWRERVRRLLDR